MKNDGWSELEYSFGDDCELNQRMSALLNELCHVFRRHADGHWKDNYKPKYVKRLAKEFDARPSLIRKLLKLNDPVISNVTYAAIEFSKTVAEDEL
jgi:hypothetical protein